MTPGFVTIFPLVLHLFDRTAQGASEGGMMDMLLGKTGPRGGHQRGILDAAAKSAARSIGSRAGREIFRGVLGGIFGGRRRR